MSLRFQPAKYIGSSKLKCASKQVSFARFFSREDKRLGSTGADPDGVARTLRAFQASWLARPPPRPGSENNEQGRGCATEIVLRDMARNDAGSQHGE
jgi:hypothetical protein